MVKDETRRTREGSSRQPCRWERLSQEWGGTEVGRELCAERGQQVLLNSWFWEKKEKIYNVQVFACSRWWCSFAKVESMLSLESLGYVSSYIGPRVNKTRLDKRRSKESHGILTVICPIILMCPLFAHLPLTGHQTGGGKGIWVRSQKTWVLVSASRGGVALRKSLQFLYNKKVNIIPKFLFSPNILALWFQ